VAWIAPWSSLAVTLLDMAVVLWHSFENSDMLQWYLEYGRDNCWSMVLAVLPSVNARMNAQDSSRTCFYKGLYNHESYFVLSKTHFDQNNAAQKLES
jgi:hypothetical protein